jgi:phage/plasmid-like protein (TIGR03299 family)
MSNITLFSDLNSTPNPAPATPARALTTVAPTPATASAIPQRVNPWQRFGRAFSPTGDAIEALHLSGLNWTTEKVGLRTEDLSPIADHVAIRRSDTGRVLGIVGREFQPLQNHAAFDFFRDLAGESRISFETAGDFDGGCTTWVQARLPDLNIRIGDDVSESYLFISNGHVGNRPLTIAPTTVRIICRNTLRMAEAQGERARKRKQSLEVGFTVRHTIGMRSALNDIRDAYAKTIRAHAATKQAYELLAAKPMTTALTSDFLRRVFENTSGPDESDRAKTIRSNRRERIDTILASPTSNVKGTAGSAFSLFQAAVEYVDHDRGTRAADGEDADEKRLVSATFGSGADLKATAWDAILEAVHA